MRQMLAATLLAVSLTAVGANTFRVTPYVQHPKPDAMTVMWLAQTNGAARVEVWRDGSADVRSIDAVEAAELSADVTGGRFTEDDVLQYCRAPELDYVNSVESGDNYPAYTREKTSAGWSMPYTAPYQYRVRLTGLEADALYRYRVTLDGDGATYENQFRTSPDPNAWRGFKFIYFSDSETEPKDNGASSGLTTDWDIPEGSPRTSSQYFATQTEAYAANLRAAVDFGTELIVMAGDLAQKGSRQCDWDEFWRHNAGLLNDPAGSIPILASPGNHDYYSYNDGGNVGITKYLSYFEYEPNQANVSDRQHELFHRVDYGPVTFLFMDACNGNDDVLLQDTSRELSRRDADGYGNRCIAPDFNPGSEMYNWLEAQLKDAQKKSAFTFVVCHQCPYSCGYHGGPIVEKGTGGGDTQTGRAVRVLEPRVHKYGVDGWLCGHDEMMERSEIEGTETLPDGTEVPHKFCVWDMGIASDGLRGNIVYNNINPYEKYRAHVDCPEVYEDGVLVEGGKHYGHLEVTIDQTEDGSWRATFDPVYIFYSKDKDGKTVYGGVRHYADKVVRISNRCKGAPPAQGITKTSVDFSTYVPTKMPRGLVTTFWNGPLSRGFSWQTDTSVTETKLWLLKGEYDQDDGNTFVSEGMFFTGEYTAKNEPGMNCHRLHVENLESGMTYSYRLGGNGHYVYGRFTTPQAEDPVTAVYFSDTQTKDAALLYKIENTLAGAVRQAGGADKVDLLVCGGDLFNASTMANVGTGGGSAYAGCMEWAWGLAVDLIAPHFPDIPWIAVPGNHDYQYYRTTCAVDYYTAGMSNAGCSSVDIGNVHFVQLPFLGTWKANGVADQYRSAFAWLRGDLAASQAPWKVVCVHWGPYSTGDHGTGRKGTGTMDSEGVIDMTKELAPILSAGHVDLVLQAHDHVFTKTVPYRWDTDGYTGSASDAGVLNLNPATAVIGGKAYDVNPNGTYYVCTGCAGHRAAEEPTYPTVDGADTFTRRDPRIVVGKVGVDSKFRKTGDYASADFHDIDANGFQMFGVLNVRDRLMAYSFYVVEGDGTVTLLDELRVSKRMEGEKSDLGLSVLLR